MTAGLPAVEHAAFAKVNPPCPYFGACGGCALQDLAYEDQLTLKRQRLQQLFSPLGAMPEIEIVGLEDPWRYRNKAEFTFAESPEGLMLGYHAAGSFWRVVDLHDCLLMPASAMRAVRTACELASATGLPAYHPRTHQGFFRYLLIRSSRATGGHLVCLMTTGGPRDVVEALGAAVVARHPEVESLYWGVTDRLADIAVPETLVHLSGAAELEEQVGPYRICIHPLSFLQPSGVQADRIYSQIVEALADLRGRVAWDLYCGVGMIALYLSRAFEKVYGIDSEPRHAELARRNAARNGIANLEVIAGPVEQVLKDRRFWLQEARPDAIVVDPPRAGLHREAAASILAARPRRIVYVSCNAQSLTRDLQWLGESFPRYRLVRLRAFDMFPQTNHVETLAILER